jgi:NDP-sugar pyrophosphorylase family protein
MASVHDRPFLTYILDQLDSAGLESAVLCTGYMGDSIEQALGLQYGRLALHYSREPALLGTGGAIRFALPCLKSDTVLIMNGDSFCDVDLARFIAAHRASGDDASMVLVERDDVSRYGQVQANPRSGRVAAFVEKGAASGRGWINAGIYLVALDWLAEIPGDRAVSLERDIFPGWIERGMHAFFADHARFIDVGTPESYRDADGFFAGTPSVRL